MYNTPLNPDAITFSTTDFIILLFVSTSSSLVWPPCFWAIPAVITNGLTIATGLLPGIGFAMLAQMIMNKKVVPFFFLGFVLSAYFKLPVVGIALLGLIIIFTTIDFTTKKTQLATAVVEGDDDDDF